MKKAERDFLKALKTGRGKVGRDFDPFDLIPFDGGDTTKEPPLPADAYELFRFPSRTGAIEATGTAIGWRLTSIGREMWGEAHNKSVKTAREKFGQ